MSALTSAESGTPSAAVLAIDAATYAGSVAAIRGGAVLAERTTAMRGEREERLMPAVAEALAATNLRVADVECVVCGAGPGSFTSLRIAGSIAKGIAQGLGVPLFAVSSLALIVAGALDSLAPGRYLAALDAMRGEAYVALYEWDGRGRLVERAPARLVSQGALEALAGELAAVVVGPAWPLPGRREGLAPRAAGVGPLVARAPELLTAVDLASWEPAYGRLAEAQVKWEAIHRRPLSADAGPPAPLP